jgi:hypothetical protein
MNEQFEVMPFAAAGQQMEQFMGRPGGRGKAGRSMGGRTRSYRAGRLAQPLSAQSGLPRYPSWGWPYRTAVAYPQPYWYPQPEPVPFEPAPFPADWAAEPPMEESKPLPAGLRKAVDNMGRTRPQYRWRGTVASALERLPKEGCAGLYLLVFRSQGKELAYSGESENLRRRLLQHRLFGNMLGRDISNFDVFIYPMPGSSKEKRRAMEKAFHTEALKLNVLTNKNREFEAEAIGESWV